MDKLKMHTPNRADDNLAEKSACPRQNKSSTICMQ